MARVAFAVVALFALLAAPVTLATSNTNCVSTPNYPGGGRATAIVAQINSCSSAALDLSDVTGELTGSGTASNPVVRTTLDD